jgi:uncharacterized protein
MAPLAGMNFSPSRSWALAAIPLVMCGCAAMTGCDDKVSAQNAKVKIAGQSYYLETALDDATRFKGLSGRNHIEPNGGMIFAFRETRPTTIGGFVMRDCPVPIDIMYLDKGGRVVSMFEMKPELARQPDEGTPGPGSADQTPANRKYEERLKQYVSRYPYNFVIELCEGSLKKLGVKEGDQIDFDREGLLKMAK